MLVLSRKERERIQIGADISVTVVRLRNGSVQLGIEAPREVRVLRGELDPHNPDQPSAKEGSPV
ncbi:MAG: carbon storage regulator [Deltaproteobacteria bacterium]|nr:carbon storage regulator [Deltaproteobacteria bacterium]